MVDKAVNQSIDFLVETQQKEKQEKLGIMDFPTQVAIVELNKNYNKMIKAAYNKNGWQG